MDKPDKLSINCPGCRKRLRVAPEAQGRRLRCPKCGCVLRVPVKLTDSKTEGLSEDKIGQLHLMRRRRKVARLGWAMAVPVVLAMMVIGLVIYGQDWINRPLPSQTADLAVNTSSTRRIRLGSEKNERCPRRALLIGVDEHFYRPSMDESKDAEFELNLVQSELRALRDSLVWLLRFPIDQVAVLDRGVQPPVALPTKRAIQESLKRFLTSSRPVDRILIHFVGTVYIHEGESFLVPTDGKMDDKTSLLPMSDLLDQVHSCNARQKLIVLDVAPHLTGGDEAFTTLLKTIQSPPRGVQIWVGIGPSGGPRVLTQYMASMPEELKQAAARRELARKLELPDGQWKDEPGDALPHIRLAPAINRATAQLLKDRWEITQPPVLLGEELPYTDEREYTQMPAQVIVVGADIEGDIIPDVGEVLEELGGTRDLHWAPLIREKVKPDLTEYVATAPCPEDVRVAVGSIRQTLEKYRTALKHNINYPGSEQAFKQELLNEQETPARLYSIYQEVLDSCESAEALLDETCPRWAAHFRLLYVRQLARMIRLQEYNYSLGQMRIETPPRENPDSKGWRLVVAGELRQRETRSLDRKRRALLDQILEDNAGTPWAVLAERERAMELGWALVELEPE